MVPGDVVDLASETVLARRSEVQAVRGAYGRPMTAWCSIAIMTAEMFLGIFLAVLLATFVMWAFSVTVYKPISEWMMRRSGWKQTGPHEWTHSDDDVPDRALVTETLARAPRIWVRKGHAHAGDRLQVFVNIPGLGWMTIFDEDWPLGATNLECLWNGGNAQGLKPTREGPSPMLEEMAEDERTNGLVAMRWSGHESVSYSSGGTPFLSRWSRDGVQPVQPKDMNADSGAESLDIK